MMNERLFKPSLFAEEQTRSNPMCYTFPRITSCDYYRYGSGGNQERINALCILSLNIVNDKVFLVLWWWFFFLVLCGIFELLFCLVQILSAKCRFKVTFLWVNSS
jgi:hypothetical protein